MRYFLVQLLVLISLAGLAGRLASQPCDLIREINNPDPANNDQFGNSIAISATKIAVGAYLDNVSATDNGRVYVFNALTGALERRIDNPSPTTLDYFGWQVAIAGDTLLVSAPYDDTTQSNSGRAYLFDINTGALLFTLAHPTIAANDLFGLSAAALGPDFIIGVPYDNDGAFQDCGRAFVFSGTTGDLIRQIQAVERENLDRFGAAVASAGNNILIGAPGDAVGTSFSAGSAYLIDGATGALIHSLPNPAAANFDEFASSVGAVGTQYLLIGAKADDEGASEAGSVYLYDAATGALLQSIPNPEPASGDEFGAALDFAGTRILIGADKDDFGATDAGSVYVYDGDPLSVNFGALLKTIHNPFAATGDHFGFSISGLGSNIAIGSTEDDTVGVNAGNAYVFTSGVCASPTPSPSPTSSPTASPSPTPSASPTPTPTPTVTSSPTESPTASPSASETPSPTESPTPTPSPTETETASPTESPTPSPSPTESPTSTPSPTETETATPTESPTASPSPTESPTPTPSPTETETATPTESPTPTLSPTESPTPTPSPTETETATPTESPSPSPSPTESPTSTPSPTETETATPTASATPTPTESPSASPSPSESPSPTVTQTPSPTETPSPSPTESPTASPTPFDDAILVSHNLPANIAANHIHPVRVTFQNTGNTSWATADGYQLGVITDTCSLVPAGDVPLPSETILPGSQATFEFELHAPGIGSCSLELQMTQTGGTGSFGEPLNLNLNVVQPVNDAMIISNTLPEMMAPEQSLVVGINVRNTGNTAWVAETDFSLAVVGSPCMIAESNRIPVRTGDLVLPGQTYQFITRIAAPVSPGSCEIDYQMIEEFVEFFGQIMDESVNVGDPPNAAHDWSVYN